MHFLRDVIIPRVQRMLWENATVELRTKCIKAALKSTKTKWDDAMVANIAQRNWSDM